MITITDDTRKEVAEFTKVHKLRIIPCEDLGSGYVKYILGNIRFGSYHSPFYNCQNFSIAGFAELLFKTTLINLTKEAIVHYIRENIGKRRSLLLIDVRENYADDVLRIFDDYVCLTKKRYISTNGSRMFLFYVNINKKKRGR